MSGEKLRRKRTTKPLGSLSGRSVDQAREAAASSGSAGGREGDRGGEGGGVTDGETVPADDAVRGPQPPLRPVPAQRLRGVPSPGAQQRGDRKARAAAGGGAARRAGGADPADAQARAAYLVGGGHGDAQSVALSRHHRAARSGARECRAGDVAGGGARGDAGAAAVRARGARPAELRRAEARHDAPDVRQRRRCRERQRHRHGGPGGARVLVQELGGDARSHLQVAAWFARCPEAGPSLPTSQILVPAAPRDNTAALASLRQTATSLQSLVDDARRDNERFGPEAVVSDRTPEQRSRLEAWRTWASGWRDRVDVAARTLPRDPSLRNDPQLGRPYLAWSAPFPRSRCCPAMARATSSRSPPAPSAPTGSRAPPSR